jgi:hypothetical protein
MGSSEIVPQAMVGAPHALRGSFDPSLVRVCLLDDGEVANYAQSFLYEPAYCLDDLLRGPATPYFPNRAISSWLPIKVLVPGLPMCSRSQGAPHHSGIVFARCDGSLTLLEGDRTIPFLSA